MLRVAAATVTSVPAVLIGLGQIIKTRRRINQSTSAAPDRFISLSVWFGLEVFAISTSAASLVSVASPS